MRGMPPVKHLGADCVPVRLIKEFQKRFRQTVLDSHRVLSKSESQSVKKTGHTLIRGEAIEKLVRYTFGRFDEQLLLDHFPPCECRCVVGRRGRVTLHWSRIASTDIAGRTLYHWSDRPRVKINGGEYIAGFTVHALLQMAERLGVSSGALRVTIARFARCSRIEADGENGFWLWYPCETDLTANIAKVLAKTKDPNIFELRLGYCPVKFLGRFAAIRTMLSPAMKVEGINDALLTFEKLATYETRPWHELTLLHELLPMVREIPKKDAPPKPFALQTDSSFRQKIKIETTQG